VPGKLGYGLWQRRRESYKPYRPARFRTGFRYAPFTSMASLAISCWQSDRQGSLLAPDDSRSGMKEATMLRIQRFSLFAAGLAMIGAVALGSVDTSAKGVSGPAFYVDGVVYRTVGTPTDLSGTGAPDHTFDVIYSLNGEQALNVATVAPGYPGFNGGRWAVHLVTFEDYAAALATHDANGSGDFDSAAEVEAAIAAGDATDQGVVRYFVCTVNKVPKGGS
jgi:hypothetical protein